MLPCSIHQPNTVVNVDFFFNKTLYLWGPTDTHFTLYKLDTMFNGIHTDKMYKKDMNADHEHLSKVYRLIPLMEMQTRKQHTNCNALKLEDNV